MSNLTVAGSTPPIDYIVVRGGTAPVPPAREPFSGAAGPDKLDAGKGVPHNQFRACAVRDIVDVGGSVVWHPEPTRSGRMNQRHVTIIERTDTKFGDPEPNPASKLDRIA